jgi:hypothetical protein
MKFGKPENKKTAQREKRQLNSRYAEGEANEERGARRNNRKFIFDHLRIHIVHGTSSLLNYICLSLH